MKKMILISLVVIVVHLTATAQKKSAQKKFDKKKSDRIDSLVNAGFENREFTGTVFVIKDGKLLMHKGYGYSDVMNKIHNGEETIYNIASITKTFTSALIMKLQESGKVSVEDNLSKYYPGFPNADKITIRHLLTHSSGLPDYVQDQGFRNSDQTKEATLEVMIGWFRDKPLNFEPGTKFMYSNSGYTLLGYVIEKITGMPYSEALVKYIFKPLEMNHTSFGPPKDTAKLARGYGMYFKNFQRLTPAVHPSISYATGAIYSTTGDLSKWHEALQSGKFLNKLSLIAMYHRDKGNYGFGWFTDSLYGKQRVSHDGNIQGYKSNINRFPGDNTCIIALSNANNSAVGGMVRNIVNILYDQPFSKSIMDAPVLRLPDSLKTAYTGTYRFGSSDKEKISIALDKDDLVLSIPGNKEMRLEALNPNVFRSGSARIEFSGPGKGQYNQVMIFNKGEFLGAQK
ncbi:serine hydrolase domain-containing protein [Flavitalea sp.]|nr:serine hydrolase domain-containing protein [Flavitalea sp.]